MYNNKKKVVITLELEYEYEKEVAELKELLKQIIDMSIIGKIEYKREK